MEPCTWSRRSVFSTHLFPSRREKPPRINHLIGMLSQLGVKSETRSQPTPGIPPRQPGTFLPISPSIFFLDTGGGRYNITDRKPHSSRIDRHDPADDSPQALVPVRATRPEPSLSGLVFLGQSISPISLKPNPSPGFRERIGPSFWRRGGNPEVHS